MGRAQREKGKRGERMLAAELTRLFGVQCRRRQQYNGTDGSDDVVFLPGVHVESKFVEKLNVREAVRTAVENCGDDIPIVCHKTSRDEWLVTTRLDSLPELVAKLYLVLAERGT